jgi:hypothetical protein
MHGPWRWTTPHLLPSTFSTAYRSTLRKGPYNTAGKRVVPWDRKSQVACLLPAMVKRSDQQQQRTRHAGDNLEFHTSGRWRLILAIDSSADPHRRGGSGRYEPGGLWHRRPRHGLVIVLGEEPKSPPLLDRSQLVFTQVAISDTLEPDPSPMARFPSLFSANTTVPCITPRTRDGRL